MVSHYDTLGIEKSADARQIKRAYFELVKQFPPERFPDKFKEIRAAYDALSDEKKRAEYDEAGALPEEAAFLFHEAQKAGKQGRVEDAIDIYKMIIKIYPGLPAVRVEYARSLERLGKTGKAIEAWTDLCSLEPDNVRYVIALADCYDMRGWRKKAIDAYHRAIEIDDGDVDCWESLLDCHLSAHEYDDALTLSNEAVNAVKKKGKESIFLYSYAAVFGAMGDPALIEGYFKDIVRLVRIGAPGKKDLQGIIPLLLNLIVAKDLMRLFPYIREMADTLPYVEKNVCEILEKAQRRFEAETLEEKGFSILFYELFRILAKGCNCKDCQLDIASMEYNILVEISTYRPQIIRLKNEHPLLFSMHAAFLNDAILTRTPEKMAYQRYKKLSRSGYYPTMLSDRYDDGNEQPAVQTVRRDGPKIGRNDPCPCGSGKKYKKCCGA